MEAAGLEAAGPEAAGPEAGTEEARSAPRWRFLISPRWLAWHAFAVVAFWGMCWLGDWQLRRAIAGNSLSWAYTFEWPLFAVMGAAFWARTIRDELRIRAGSATGSTESAVGGAESAGTGPPESAGTGPRQVRAADRSAPGAPGRFRRARGPGGRRLPRPAAGAGQRPRPLARPPLTTPALTRARLVVVAATRPWPTAARPRQPVLAFGQSFPHMLRKTLPKPDSAGSEPLLLWPG